MGLLSAMGCYRRKGYFGKGLLLANGLLSATGGAREHTIIHELETRYDVAHRETFIWQKYAGQKLQQKKLSRAKYGMPNDLADNSVLEEDTCQRI
jgi:hypothetical protein